jgi:WhiB family redox-sensing transcriptional regulator
MTQKAHNHKNTPTHKLRDIQQRHWMQHAACKGTTHLMFPKEHKDITYIPQARKICSNCPVKPQCLTYALDHPTGDLHGVWAGLTSRQLKKEQQKQNITPTRPTNAQIIADLTHNPQNN